MADGTKVQTDHTGRLVEVVPPTPERLAKGDITTFETERGGKEIRSTLHPMDFYLAKNAVSQKQFDAGDRFYRLWRAAGLGVHCPQHRYTFEVGADPLSHEDVQDLWKAYAKARKSVRSALWLHAVVAVCCYGEWAVSLRAIPGVNTRRAPMRLLRNGLDDLAKHFGY
jgi:hypothetical protein